MNTIRAQEFTSAGMPAGSEFVIGSSNGRLHSLAPTSGGGFVAVYQQGGTSTAFPAGNIVAQVYNSSNTQTSTFTVDNSIPVASITHTVVEADGDIVIYWRDRQNSTSPVYWRSTRFDATGTELGTTLLNSNQSVESVIRLATGGHAVIGFTIPFSTEPSQIFVNMFSTDGSISRYVEVASVPQFINTATIAPLANGGFIASWNIDTDPSNVISSDIMARAFNAIGNPIGPAFLLNSITTGNQSLPSLAQLTDGDIVAAWTDESLLNGDSSGPGVNLRRIDYDPVNQAPTTSNFTFSLYGVTPGTPVIEDPDYIDGFTGIDGYDSDGDPLAISSISNVSNGTVVLNPDGTLTLTAAVGASGRLAFDYTISDGQGGFATARATVTLPSDFVTLRPNETALIDFLANDYYTPGAGATPFTVTPPGPLFGGAAEGFASVVNTAGGPRILYDPLGNFSAGTNSLNSSYFNLLVGQTTQVRFFYSNNEVFNVDVTATLEGWAQLGGTGADNLVGTSRPDHLSGGTGAANTLTGGAGNDWYTVSAVGDSIVELANEGLDSVRSNLLSYTLAANVENLHLFGFLNVARQGTGNDGNNLITSYTEAAALYGMGGDDTLIGSSSSDTLDGGDGSDLLYGGVGSDVMNGGNGIDTVNYVASGLAININLATNTLSGGDAQGDTLTNVEIIVGSNYNDIFVGNSADNSFEGGVGADNIDGGAGFDTARYGRSNAAVSINLASNSHSGGHAAGDILTSIEAVVGSNYADTLIGNASDNVLDGGLGNDMLRGGDGDDTLIGGDGNDTADYGSTSAAISAYLAAGTQSGTSGGADTLVSIENLIASSFNDTVLGSDVANELYGNGGSDELYGLGGSDYMSGGDGADYLSGGAGDDLMIGGAGADIVLGGLGDDSYYQITPDDLIVEYDGQGNDRIYTEVDYTLRAGSYIETLGTTINTGTDAINLTGNELANVIVGNAGVNRLDGAGGADTIYGGAGLDYFYFSSTLGASNVDVVGDFASVDDLLMIDRRVFSNTLPIGFLDASAFLSGAGATAATTAAHRFVHDSTTGDLYYDADGAGGQAAVRFANIGAGTAIQSYDFFVI
jgi:Ca2+-binding RTX toxin-like protein